MPKSPKGFVAIDLDGMTVVQKIDKHLFYGLKHPESHIRQLLIEYAKAAQNTGYDIIILTARPKIVEFFLTSKIGTKSTNNIISTLNAHGVTIHAIERSSPLTLKGGKIQAILNDYQKHGASSAIGILLDDQLKQINHVRAMGNPHLFAYDINHKIDLIEFITHVPLLDQSPFHPDKVIDALLTPDEHLVKKGLYISNECHQLTRLQDDLKKANNLFYAKELELIQTLIDDLCITLFEAEYRDYEPQINWVSNVTKVVHSLMSSLINGQPIISHESISNASMAIFGVSKLPKAKPNTGCEQIALELLQRLSVIPQITELKQICMTFEKHLSAINNPSNTIQNQRTELNRLQSLLNAPHQHPTTALHDFTMRLMTNKLVFLRTAKGTRFLERIRLILTRIPYIGEIFKTNLEKSVCNLIHYPFFNIKPTIKTDAEENKEPTKQRKTK